MWPVTHFELWLTARLSTVRFANRLNRVRTCTAPEVQVWVQLRHPNLNLISGSGSGTLWTWTFSANLGAPGAPNKIATFINKLESNLHQQFKLSFLHGLSWARQGRHITYPSNQPYPGKSTLETATSGNCGDSDFTRLIRPCGSRQGCLAQGITRIIRMVQYLERMTIQFKLGVKI